MALLILKACGNKHVTAYQSIYQEPTNHYCELDQIGLSSLLSDKDVLILEDKKRIRDEKTINAMFKSAAIKIIENSESESECLKIFNQGTKIFNEMINQDQRKMAKENGFEPDDKVEILATQKRITDLWRMDQSARMTLVKLATKDQSGALYWANRLATAHTIRIDISSTAYIEELLKKYDWIDRHRFGNAVSSHAWILIQHADDRVDLQAKVLKRMHPYLKTGGIKPANYAYLWDRVAVNSGKKQRYGTQPIWTCVDNKLELQPVEDMSIINDLRKKMGMNSVESGLQEMSLSVCGKH